MNTLRRTFLRHIAQTSPSPLLVEADRAEGIFFYSPEGIHYYDLIAGVTVNNLGHANKAAIEAVQRAAAEYKFVTVC